MKRRASNWRFAEFPELPCEARWGIIAGIATALGSTAVTAGSAAAITGSIGAVAAAGGLASDVVGGVQQSKAVSNANTQNQANVTNANNQAWTSYLMQRGLNPGGTVPYGTIPTNAAAVNTKLPLWATVNVPNKFAGPGGSSVGGPSLSSALAPSSSGPVGAPGATGAYAPRGIMPVNQQPTIGL